jgi:hypothetical protein
MKTGKSKDTARGRKPKTTNKKHKKKTQKCMKHINHML